MKRDRKDNKKMTPRPMQKKRKPRPCIFCIGEKMLDYKDVSFMRRFITDRGKIAPRRMSGCCAAHQRIIAKKIKRARQMGMAPYVVD